MDMDPSQQVLCTVAATLTVASFAQGGGAAMTGVNAAAAAVTRYRQILAEISKGGGLLRAASP